MRDCTRHRVWLCLLIIALFTDSEQAISQADTGSHWFTSEPAMLGGASGSLHGTVLAPRAGSTLPVVLIHPGSGPTDRDGNNPLLPGKNNSLRLLAEGLAAWGIASLRIDKRGIAGSAAAATGEADLRIDNYAKDAADWVRQLRRDTRFDRVVILGHSEGALIGALAASQVPVDGSSRSLGLAGAAR